MATGTEKVKKEANARVRACLDEQLTHVRIGSWRGNWDGYLELLGLASDLHGSVCTCCPKRTQATT